MLCVDPHLAGCGRVAIGSVGGGVPRWLAWVPQLQVWGGHPVRVPAARALPACRPRQRRRRRSRRMGVHPTRRPPHLPHQRGPALVIILPAGKAAELEVRDRPPVPAKLSPRLLAVLESLGELKQVRHRLARGGITTHASPTTERVHRSARVRDAAQQRRIGLGIVQCHSQTGFMIQ